MEEYGRLAIINFQNGRPKERNMCDLFKINTLLNAPTTFISIYHIEFLCIVPSLQVVVVGSATAMHCRGGRLSHQHHLRRRPRHRLRHQHHQHRHSGGIHRGQPNVECQSSSLSSSSSLLFDYRRSVYSALSLSSVIANDNVRGDHGRRPVLGNNLRRRLIEQRQFIARFRRESVHGLTGIDHGRTNE